MAPMITTGHVKLAETIKRLLRKGAISSVSKILKKTHSADIALLMRNITPKERLKIFSLIDSVEVQAEVISHLDSDIIPEFIESLGIDNTVSLLMELPSDDRNEILSHLPEELKDKIVEKVIALDSKNIEMLLKYEENTAGSIMSTEFLALNKELTVEEAIKYIRTEPDVEMMFYIYVINEFGHLVGVISLRQLVISPPDKKLKDIMETDVISVTPDVDQEEVARLVSKYDFLAIPVVDENNKLIGIVTVDDVVDILREEASEDMLRLAGAGSEMRETWSIFTSIKKRMPWLAVSWIGEFFNSFVIQGYQNALEKILPLASYIPIIMAMGGNVGTQSLTITVRGIVTGRIEFKQIFSLLGREILIGFLLGVTYGILLAFSGYIIYHKDSTVNSMLLGFTLGFSLAIAMTIAALLGTFFPLFLHRIKVDPAVATGPFVTTSMDIVGMVIYFTVAKFVFNL